MNSRRLAVAEYEQDCLKFDKATAAGEKHFLCNGIVEYLSRRHKFNPQYRNDLEAWCLEDVALYEAFLIESHEHDLFTIDERVDFHERLKLRAKKLAAIRFEDVRAAEFYFVPRLPSYDLLEELYANEQDHDRLDWLKTIGDRIGYGATEASQPPPPAEFDLTSITCTIEVPKSGGKGELFFVNSSGHACSTEDAFKDYMEQRGWTVMRAEVSFWQAMFCLSFWEEIWHGCAVARFRYSI
ncbi:MAG: hypothetical protein R3D67_06885 [Hyphomicrobiaceae bacterium]